MFCNFFEFSMIFLESKNIFWIPPTSRLKNRISCIREQLKNFEKLFLNSPYKRVPTNQVLDFSKVYLCFHRTFMKILKNFEIYRYSFFLNCAKKLLKISKIYTTCSRDLTHQVLDTQLTCTWFPKDFKKYEYRRISKFFNIFNESPVETYLDLGKI